jgi:hypothetical protein
VLQRFEKNQQPDDWIPSDLRHQDKYRERERTRSLTQILSKVWRFGASVLWAFSEAREPLNVPSYGFSKSADIALRKVLFE